jgi:oligopeptide/dipeptide ABC transporter ATP-binding protein
VSDEPALAIRGLRTSFPTPGGNALAVDGIDLDVRHGRTTCLVGESGCGKSVTALSILGLIRAPGAIDPASVIEFGGENLVTAPADRLRRVRGGQIGMVFQEPMSSFTPVYTIGAQIAELVRHHRQASRREAHEIATEMLARVGIPDPARRVNAYPHELSGGMRQRAMIAMALSCDPVLLIADEPTTALDVTVQAQILELLVRLQADLEMALLLITHDFGVVAEVADDVAVMYAGRIVERGPADELLRAPRHPYTIALMDSIPLAGSSWRTDRLRTIPGTVPSPTAWPSGCRFSPRCARAVDRCRSEDQPLLRVGADEAACWRAAADELEAAP